MAEQLYEAKYWHRNKSFKLSRLIRVLVRIPERKVNWYKERYPQYRGGGAPPFYPDNRGPPGGGGGGGNDGRGPPRPPRGRPEDQDGNDDDMDQDDDYTDPDLKFLSKQEDYGHGYKSFKRHLEEDKHQEFTLRNPFLPQIKEEEKEEPKNESTSSTVPNTQPIRPRPEFRRRQPQFDPDEEMIGQEEPEAPKRSKTPEPSIRTSESIMQDPRNYAPEDADLNKINEQFYDQLKPKSGPNILEDKNFIPPQAPVNRKLNFDNTEETKETTKEPTTDFTPLQKILEDEDEYGFDEQYEDNEEYEQDEFDYGSMYKSLAENTYQPYAKEDQMERTAEVTEEIEAPTKLRDEITKDVEPIPEDSKEELPSEKRSEEQHLSSIEELLKPRSTVVPTHSKESTSSISVPERAKEVRTPKTTTLKSRPFTPRSDIKNYTPGKSSMRQFLRGRITPFKTKTQNSEEVKLEKDKIDETPKTAKVRQITASQLERAASDQDSEEIRISTRSLEVEEIKQLPLPTIEDNKSKEDEKQEEEESEDESQFFDAKDKSDTDDDNKDQDQDKGPDEETKREDRDRDKDRDRDRDRDNSPKASPANTILEDVNLWRRLPLRDQIAPGQLIDKRKKTIRKPRELYKVSIDKRKKWFNTPKTKFKQDVQTNNMAKRSSRRMMKINTIRYRRVKHDLMRSELLQHQNQE